MREKTRAGRTLSHQCLVFISSFFRSLLSSFLPPPTAPATDGHWSRRVGSEEKLVSLEESERVSFTSDSCPIEH
ncbi:hypothetical protein L596_001529 [Steinernema carpocapsae]|uniref:Uncharacterized protein n=1 Tax=Steinernema carpocapsae TaxID=34508 RepID=A0A4U8UQH3_STECR|nr:hypothetical protein L596_001529 [Steinernema carpocapsae]